MVPISEIFYSIQGEGRLAGFPAIFVRVGGCNLKCPGFSTGKHYGCDSYHSVDPMHRDSWEALDSKGIIENINRVLPKYPESLFKPIIVLTGGEPTLYQADLEGVITYFATRGYTVQIETNASVVVRFDNYPILSKCQFAMSVKLDNSGEPAHKRLRVDNIENILRSSENSFFKFVVKEEKDVTEAEEILKEVLTYADVYLMPMAETEEQLKHIAKYVWQACLEKGFKYSDRLHIRLFDDKRGV